MCFVFSVKIMRSCGLQFNNILLLLYKTVIYITHFLFVSSLFTLNLLLFAKQLSLIYYLCHWFTILR
uniref:Uncharacterized protein n=1 Tax=Octopus bimaculoides TaxID=37653 RepID=A0A0L8HLV3_OCTBM